MLAVWILIAVLASLLLLLAVPVDLAFSVQCREGRREGSGTLRWLFGLVRLDLGGPGVQAGARSESPKLARRRRKRAGARRVVAALRRKGFGRRVLKLARDLLRRVWIRYLDMDIRLGLDDPADTGRLWAVVGPLVAMLPLPPEASLAIEPEFAAEIFELDGEGRIRIIPLQVLLVLLVFFLSPGTLRVLYTMRAGA